MLRSLVEAEPPGSPFFCLPGAAPEAAACPFVGENPGRSARAPPLSSHPSSSSVALGLGLFDLRVGFGAGGSLSFGFSSCLHRCCSFLPRRFRCGYRVYAL